MEIERMITRLVDQVERRYYGKYRAFVVDNDDPEQLGRLKLRVPSVLGDAVVTGWAMPCLPYGGEVDQGMFFIPDPDAGVWVEFEEGDLEFPIWVGTFWSKPGGHTEIPTPNDDSGASGNPQRPPTRKIIKTSAGHTIQFEDADDEVRLIITDGQNENRVVFGESGLSVINKSNEILMTDQGIEIKDGNGNSTTKSGSGIVISDGNGNSVVLDATSGGIPGTPGVAINGSNPVCVKGLLNWLMSHTHIGNMGAPTPVNPANLVELAAELAVPSGNILSQKVTVG